MNRSPASPRGKSRFLPNTVALVLQTMVATLITLAQVKVLSNYLSKETFGLFASLRGFSLLLTIVAANGLPPLLVRYLPTHEARGERLRALRLSTACVVASIALLAGLAGVVQLLRPWLLAFTDTALFDRELLLWFYAMTLGVMLKTVVYGGLSGLRRIGSQVAMETVSLAAILLWILIARDHLSLLLLFKIFGSIHLVTLALAMPFFFVSLMRISGPGDTTVADKKERYHYRPYLAWATGLSFVALAFTDVDRYLLAQLLTLEVLALFHIGARVGRLANRLLGVSNLAFQPEVTRLNAEGRAARIDTSTRIFVKFNSTMAALLTFIIILFAKEIIVFITSSSYLAAQPLLVLLALSLPLTTVAAPLTTVMKALDQVRGALVSDIAWASTYVAVMITLAPRFGLIGVGCAHLAACVLQLLVALRISSLSLDLRFVAGLILRLLAAGVVAFMPVVITAVAIKGVPGAWLVLGKIILFIGGLFVFRWLMRRMTIFAPEEREILHTLFASKGIRFVRGVI